MTAVRHTMHRRLEWGFISDFRVSISLQPRAECKYPPIGHDKNFMRRKSISRSFLFFFFNTAGDTTHPEKNRLPNVDWLSCFRRFHWSRSDFKWNEIVQELNEAVTGLLCEDCGLWLPIPAVEEEETERRRHVYDKIMVISFCGSSRQLLAESLCLNGLQTYFSFERVVFVS